MKKTHFIYGVLLSLVLYILFASTDFIKLVDYKLYDLTNSFLEQKSDKNPSSVVIVDIDERSLETLGQWPWSRLIVAELIKNINQAVPASIGIDILFAEKDKTSPQEIITFYERFFGSQVSIDGLDKKYYDNESILATTLQKSAAVLPVYLNSYNDNPTCVKKEKNLHINGKADYLKSDSILCSISDLQKSVDQIGYINTINDKDGILRRIELFRLYKDNLVAFFALANLLHVDSMVEKDGRFSILNSSFKVGENGTVLLKFYPMKHYKVISALDVLNQKVDLKTLQGKFVLIGASAIGLYDRHIVTSSLSLPGSFIHATLIDNILNQDLRYEEPYLKQILLLFAFLLSLIVLQKILQKKYLPALALYIIPNLLFAILNIITFSKNVYINIGYFLVPFSISFFLASFAMFVVAYYERKNFLENITKAHSSTIESMALVVETRDVETGAHIKRTKEYIKILAQYMYDNNIYKNTLTKEYRDLLYRAAPLHDIGKVGIPDMILKKPAKLSVEEFEIMKEHTTLGKNILENAIKENPDNKFLEIARNIAHYHHEKWNGSGYPCGLKKEEIPLEARLMALSDVYDALISRRCYKSEISFEDSEEIIIQGKGIHFDPLIVEAFLVLKGEFQQIALKIK